MKVIYTSPVFSHNNGTARQFSIPMEAIGTYAKRDECLLKMIAMGGIYAEPTAEFIKIRSKMLAAKRKIQKMGWSSELQK